MSHDASAIAALLAACRAGSRRVAAEDLAAAVEGGALVVDTRPVEQRARDGELPGAVVVDRNVLEWRLDPSSPDRLPCADDPGRRIIVVCNEGYSSSLAAATLRLLGLEGATDLAGGYQAWLALAARRSTATRDDERDPRPALAGAGGVDPAARRARDARDEPQAEARLGVEVSQSM